MGRLTDALRRRLRAGSAAPPATLPRLQSGEEAAVVAAARDAPQSPVAHEPPADPGPEPPAEPDRGARIDAARERLRATIEPPDPDADPG